MPQFPRRHDLSGLTFGRLLVIGPSDVRPGTNRARWLCRCSCGAEKWIDAASLKRKNTLSCGCLNRDNCIALATHHGHATTSNKSPEYRTWTLMKQRCLNPNNDRYHRYGGRGITVCAQWHDFAQFFADMGPRPSLRHSIERLNNDGNYEPGNCVWATIAEQARNKSLSRKLTFNGETHCITEWAAKLGIKQNTLQNRINRGWPLCRALTETSNRA